MLNDKRVAILVAEGFEQVWNHFDKADHFKVDVPLDSADAASFDALLLPSGVANPDQLRMNPKAVAFVREFFELDKPVAAICHGPWTLMDAGDGLVSSLASLKISRRSTGR